MRPFTSAALAVGSSVLVLCACGGSQRQQEIDGLKKEIARVQQEHDDLERRVGELEDHAPASDGKAGLLGDGPIANPADITPGGEEPKLKVVKLEPAAASTVTTNAGSTTIAAPIDDDSPRPFLKIGPDGMSETFPDDVAPPKSAKTDAKAGKDYDAALALYKAKKYQQALDAFAGFVVRFPDHPHVANALFWRGECYYALGQWTSAEEQLEGMLASHPSSAKVPDALLDLGLTEKKLGSAAKAKAAFARLRKEFPGSQAAKKIPPEDAS